MWVTEDMAKYVIIVIREHYTEEYIMNTTLILLGTLILFVAIVANIALIVYLAKEIFIRITEILANRGETKTVVEEQRVI